MSTISYLSAVGTTRVTILFACVLSGVGVLSVLSGVGVPTFVSGVLLQLQIANDRPGVGGVESATWDNILVVSLHLSVSSGWFS